MRACSVGCCRALVIFSTCAGLYSIGSQVIKLLLVLSTSGGNMIPLQGKAGLLSRVSCNMGQWSFLLVNLMFTTAVLVSQAAIKTEIWNLLDEECPAVRCPAKVKALPTEVRALKRLAPADFRRLAYIFEKNPNHFGSPLRLIRQLPQQLRCFSRFFSSRHPAVVCRKTMSCLAWSVEVF